MGRLTKPPMALSKEEFDRRVAAGAKIFEEIDPEFWSFYQKEMRQHRLMFTISIVMGALFAFGGLIVSRIWI